MPHHLTYEEQIIVALRRITRAADIHSHLLQRRFGITGPQLSTLRVVQRLQPVSTGALARAACIGYATLTGVLDRLEEHGYVTRNRDHSDRRTVIVNITKSGDELLKSAPSLLQNRLREELRNMSQDERSVILDSLLQVASLMESDSSESESVDAQAERKPKTKSSAE